MSTFRRLGEIAEREWRNKVFGIVVGVVSNNKDTTGKYRVKVRFPWLPNGDDSGSSSEESDWCRVATPMAGNGRGLFVLPEVGDEVVVAFEHGDMGRPYVIGAMWNGKDAPTKDNKDGKNNIRSFTSRAGAILEFDDTDGSEKITLQSKGAGKLVIDDKNKLVQLYDHTGKNFMEIDGTNNKVSVTSEGTMAIKSKTDFSIEAKTVSIKSTGGDVTMQSSANLTMKAGSNFSLKGSGSGEVNSSGALTVKGATVNIN